MTNINRWLEAAWQNVRYAVRVLMRAPGFTAVAVLSIAIGIGANTAIFSLLNALLLKTLPVRHPEELVFVRYKYLEGRSAGSVYTGYAYPVYSDLRERSAASAELFAFGGAGVDLVWSGEVERIDGLLVSGNFLEVLGVQPVLGRTITPADDRVPGGHPVAMLSYSFWKNRFGGDAGAVGRQVVMNGLAYTVIGVLPNGFTGTTLNSHPDVFVPMMMQPQIQGQESALARRGWKWLSIGGRLRAGVSRARAEAALTGAFAGIEKGSAAETRMRMSIVLEPAARGDYWQRDRFANALYVLMAAVGLVLLIACANVANLTMARAASWHREISVRLAIGAGRPRLIAQLLTESLAIAASGGVLGIVLAYAADSALLRIFGAGARALPLDVRPDVRVLAFTLAISVATGVLFGIFPAFSATRVDVNPALKEDAGGTGSRRRLLARRILVAAQVALSLVLLSGAGLFAKTLRNLRTMDIGYDRQGVLMADLDPRQAGYRGDGILQFYDELLGQVRQIPGVEAAGVASLSVLSGGMVTHNITAEGATQHPDALMTVVSAGYLEAMRMRLVAGRAFTARDNLPNAPKTIVINEALARACFGDANPVGRRLGIQGKADAEIIGVVRNAKYVDLRDGDRPACYIPPRAYGAQAMGLYVRTAIEPAAVAAPIRRELHAINTHMPLARVRTLEEQSERSLVEDRLLATLSEAFGAIALALAVVGLYGVLSFMVARRTGEIGIRLALGAGRIDVMWLVLRESVAVVLAGIVVGAWGAGQSGKLVKGLLFGVKAWDVWTVAGAAVLLLVTALAATWVPARRAARIEPVTALRYE